MFGYGVLASCARSVKLENAIVPKAFHFIDSSWGVSLPHRLEVNLGAELKHPPGRIGVVRRDTPEGAGRVEVLPCGNILRKREIGVVEDIECFQAKFNLLGFRERYQFAESQIGVVDSRAMEVVPSFVPQHARRFLRESVRIEVVVGLSGIRSELERRVARMVD